jgi:low temperature requirement protein LtrA
LNALLGRLAAERPHLLRPRHGHARVTYVELFFDLVFVFAITQLSHGLLHDLTLAGALRTGVMFLAVWWVWIYTAWAMNWLDPERAPVRLLLFAMMLAGLVLSVAIPHAFSEDGRGAGLLFAATYVAIQVGRTAFTTWAIGPGQPALYRNFQRITGWKIAAAPLWLAGGLAGPQTRLWLWALAVAVEYAGPAFRFWLPRLGASEVADWQVEGAHLSERCALFVIIALGESILVTGATFSDKAWSAGTVAAFLVAFTGSIAMWWVYFDTGAERAARQITRASDPGRMARAGYTYFHLLIGAGIVLCAVADELVLAHPDGHAAAEAVAAIVGGPAVYLLGNALFKRLTLGWLPLSHNVGLGLLAALAALSGALSPLGLATGATAVLVLVAVWERLSLHGRVDA